jgi:hypothetical protein
MNPQTSYHAKTDTFESEKINQVNYTTESDPSAKNYQRMPDAVELIRIMFGTVTEENARNMTPIERQAFYNIAKKILSFTDNLN